MLEHVVEHDVVQREQVLQLDVAEAVARGGEVGEEVGHEDEAVVALDALEEVVDDGADGGREDGLVGRGVGGPATDLLVDEACVERQAAVGQRSLNYLIRGRNQ